MNKNFDVFISHSSLDKKVADAVCTYLESHGLICWIAPRNIDRTAGKDYAESIINGIQASRIMLIVFSHHANESRFVKNEVERAFHYQLPLLPFKIDDAEPVSSLELFLSPVHWLSAGNKPVSELFDRLLENCLSLLSKDFPPILTVPEEQLPESVVSFVPVPELSTEIKIQKAEDISVSEENSEKENSPIKQNTWFKRNRFSVIAIAIALVFLSCYLLIYNLSPAPQITKPLEAKIVQPADTVLAAVKKSGKWGWINPKDEVVIPIQYDTVRSFSENLAAVCIKNKWGFIDKSNKTIVPSKYDEVKSFSEGRAIVKLGQKYGAIDKTGKEVIPVKYNVFNSFHEQLASVIEKEHVAFVDSNGKTIFIFNDTYGTADFHDGIAILQNSNRGSYSPINKMGKILYIFGEYTDEYSEGLCRQGLEKAGFMDINFNLVIAQKFTSTTGFHNGLAGVMQKSGCGFINKKGKTVIPLKYGNVGIFTQDRAPVMDQNKKWGFTDGRGTQLTPFYYEWVKPYNKGFAGVQNKLKCGFIDLSGKVTIPIKYDNALVFRKNSETVTENESAVRDHTEYLF